jgi:hypothetical protein
MKRLKRLWCHTFHCGAANLMYAGGREWECRRCGLRGEVDWQPRKTYPGLCRFWSGL